MSVRIARRPRLEALEDRWLPATVTWINPGDGDWYDPMNWSSGSVPEANDDVFIGSGVVVTRDGEGSVLSLVCEGTLRLNSGELTLEQSSSIAQLTLGGTLRASGGLDVTESFTWEAGVLDGTTITLFGTATFSGSDGLILRNVDLRNQAILDFEGGSLQSESGTFTNLASGAVWVTGDSQIDGIVNAGRLLIVVPEGATFATIANTGEVIVQSGDLQVGVFTQTDGQTLLLGSTLSAEVFELLGSSLIGQGTFEGDLENQGRVVPLGGTLTVTGDYVQSSQAVLTIVAQTQQPVELVVGGTATLAGILDARFAPGENAVEGTIYAALTAQQVQGVFETVFSAPSEPPGFNLVPVYADTTVTLQVQVGEGTTPGENPAPDLPLFPVLPPPPSPPVTQPAPSPTLPSAQPLQPLAPAPQTTQTTTLSARNDPTILNTRHSILVHHTAVVHHTTTAPLAAPLTTAPVGDLQPAQVTDGPIPQGGPAGWAVGGGDMEVIPAAFVPPAPPTQALAYGERLRGASGLSAWGVAEEPQLADELFSSFSLELPEIDLPNEDELLEGADIAAVLVVGGKARANLVPQRGSQLSGVATLLSGEVSEQQTTDASPLAGLFMSPLSVPIGLAGATASPGEPTHKDSTRLESGEEPGPLRQAVALALAAVAGVASSVGISARRERQG